MSWLSEALSATTNDIGEAIANTPTRQKMNELRTAYRGAIDGIRGDASLSELGKAQLIARAWTNTRAELASLSQRDFDAQVNRYNELERQVFGTASASAADAVSFRDATDRASKINKPEAALDALGTAELSGDTVLMKAIVMRAWQSGWTGVVDRFAITHPKVTDQLAELGALRDWLNSLSSRLGGGMAGGGLIKPAELTNLTLAQIAEYAAAEPSPSLSAVQAARMRGEATPQDEEDARKRESGR
jgi:hypothetical protein